jgi:hypothetical protein
MIHTYNVKKRFNKLSFSYCNNIHNLINANISMLFNIIIIYRSLLIFVRVSWWLYSILNVIIIFLCDICIIVLGYITHLDVTLWNNWTEMLLEPGQTTTRCVPNQTKLPHYLSGFSGVKKGCKINNLNEYIFSRFC